MSWRGSLGCYDLGQGPTGFSSRGSSLYVSRWYLPGCVCVSVLVIQSCLTLCDPMDCSLPGSSVHGSLQAGILGWLAILFSRGIFPTQGLNLGLLCGRQIPHRLSHQGMKSYKTHIRSEVGWGFPRRENVSQMNSPQKSLCCVLSVPETPWLSGEPVYSLEFVFVGRKSIASIRFSKEFMIPKNVFKATVTVNLKCNLKDQYWTDTHFSEGGRQISSDDVWACTFLATEEGNTSVGSLLSPSYPLLRSEAICF